MIPAMIIAFIVGILAGLIAWATDHKRVGGIHFWRLGRFGGSFYVAKKTLQSSGD